MPHNVDITVHCIARTQVDRKAVKAWLDAVGVSDDYELPHALAITDPALLIAMAGKRCYKSFEPGLNPNVTKIREDYAKYLDNVLSSGHGCYDSETEVLTASGWKGWPEVKGEDPLATLDLSGNLVYEKPVSVGSFDYSGRMFRVESQGVDLLVTPNHKMFVCMTTTREGRQRDRFVLIPAEEVGTKSHAYMKTASGWTPGPAAGHPNSMNALRLLGFAIGDGHYSGGLGVRFRLRRARKIAWLHSVVTALNTEDKGIWDLTTPGEDRYIVKVPEHFKPLLEVMYVEGEKCIPQSVLMTSDRQQLTGLLEGLMQSDGHKGRTGSSFDTTSNRLSGQIQQLCLHCGLAANVCYTYGPEQRRSSYGKKPLTRLSILQRSLKPEVNKYSGAKGRSFWIEDWAGEVFCAQMPDTTQHVLYVRRNGIPVWCGNSVLEHSVYTFAIEGVSRVFTGETNRHRAGVAISEASMRYIRYSESIPFWMPESVRGPAVLPEEAVKEAVADHVRRVLEMKDPGHTLDVGLLMKDHKVDQNTVNGIQTRKQLTREVLYQAFRNQEVLYGLLEELWKEELQPSSAFAGKKALTSMFRRIVGMGVATGGVWSGNLRALRHMVTMRASPQAEEEICHVFCKIAKFLSEEEPMIFGDFTLTDEGFWVPKYMKV